MKDFFRASSHRAMAGDLSQGLFLAKTRLLVVAGVFMLGYLAISLRLADLTLLRAPDDAKAAAGQVAAAAGGATLRGTILDRNGELIATSLKMASVYADATLVAEPAEAARRIAAILTGESAENLRKKLSSGKKFVWLARNITPRQQYAINVLGYPGIGFEEEDRRIYPHGRLVAHITGYTDVDGKGIAGVEKFFDKALAAGEEPVRLTIDLRIQHLLHRELLAAVKKFSAKAGIGVVTDVNTGEIIAMVSLPDFDPHHPGEASDDAKFNRVSLGVFEMGSTFKLFSVAAALDSGRVHFGSTFDAIAPLRYGRFTISDYHAEKRVLTVPEIFTHSSNIGTGKIALHIGGAALKDFYETMGFFAPLALELPERGQPLYPRPWREISTITTSFGHGIAVSPLHLMQAAGALVNGGVMVPLTLALPQKRPLGLSPEGRRVVRPDTSLKIRQLMELTVAGGTGKNARVEGYGVGGKTGTAEKTQGRGYNQNALFSSFLGVFPIENPRYAVLAILDEPKATKDTHGYATGGWTAAPVTARVTEQMAPLYQIAPDFDDSSDILALMAPYIKADTKGAALAPARSRE